LLVVASVRVEGLVIDETERDDAGKTLRLALVVYPSRSIKLRT